MPPRNKLAEIVMNDRRLLFRNFSGEAGRYNAAGDRNFNVVLEPEEAARMEHDGWNVKYLKPRDPDELPLARIEVAVAFNKMPPRVILITSRGKTALPENLVGILDWAEFDNVDLIIRPYEWEVNSRRGVKAYLKAIYCTLHEDELELKYADVPDAQLPDSAQGSIMMPEGFVPRGAVQVQSETLAVVRDRQTPALGRGEDSVPF